MNKESISRARLKRTIYRTFSIGSILAITVYYQACGRFDPSSDISSLSSLGSGGLASRACTPEPGHTPLRRMTNVEYNNTVADLLYVSMRPADAFPMNAPGPSGFTNDYSALSISQQITESYVDAAETLAKAVIASKAQAQGAYSRLAPCATQSSVSPDCARNTIRNLATRAFRRPVTENGAESELERLMTVFRSGNGDFDLGLRDVIVAVLIDPNFLFHVVISSQPLNPNHFHNLNSYELASRLSYFIWQTMPDETLFLLAQTNQLRDQEILTAQIERMLRDPRAKRLATYLQRDWLHLAKLDGASINGVSDSLVQAMLSETEKFLEDIISNDRNPAEILTSDTSFINSDLANHYGINAAGATSSNFVKVQLPSERRGVLTHASVLTTHGGGQTYTHPVSRGLFVADSFFCSPPPAPPPGIPTLEAITEGTIKEKLKQHTANPACIGCHKIMDGMGLGLENFDMTGKFRTHYIQPAGVIIDPSGEIPDRYKFQTHQEMITYLGLDTQVHACMSRRLMGLALSRSLKSTSEYCVSTEIGRRYFQPGSRFSDVIKEIVLSNQFRAQQGVKQ